MMRKALLPLAALTIALTYPAAAQQSQGGAFLLIVPGKSLAGVELGQSSSSTLARFGRPSEARGLRDGTLYAFPRYGLTIYAGDGFVRAVSTNNSLLRTPEGIAIGSTVAEVRRVYGAQFMDAVVEGLTGIAYDHLGIAFGLDGTVVTAIIVYAPRSQAAAVTAAAVTAAAVTAAVAPAPTPPAPPAQMDAGLVSLPRLEGLRPFTPETQYMSVAGFLRYTVYQQTGVWLTKTEAARLVQSQQRVRL